VKSALDATFGVSERGSTLRREVRGGVVTFLTMSYIVFVQPVVLSGTGMDFGAVMAATCLSGAFASVVMGLWANVPVALAPGMGQNFFFALGVVGAMGVPWPTALAVVFLSGALFVALTVLRVREMVLDAIPRSLQHAIGAGIGFFIGHVGLRWAGIVVHGDPPRLGDLGSPPTMLSAAGLVLTAALLARRVPGAFLIGLLGTAAAGLVTGVLHWHGLVAPPPSIEPTFLALDLAGALRWEMAGPILVFLYMALFDAVGTLVAVLDAAGLMRDGKLPRADRALLADAAGTTVGALLGTSTVTAYVESAAGVESGARTGLSAVVAGVLLLAALFFAPLAQTVGEGVGPRGDLHPVTAPVLALVGALMTRAAVKVPWNDPTEAVPAFLTIAGIPLTYSIADGIALGFVAYPLCKLLAGRPRDAHPLLYALAAGLVARYAFL
jgi:AGZA family xanthine/uracil permease-like MFS transporter